MGLLTLGVLLVFVCTCDSVIDLKRLDIPRFVFINNTDRHSFKQPPWYQTLDVHGLSKRFSKPGMKISLQNAQTDDCMSDYSMITSSFSKPSDPIGITLFKYFDSSTKIPNGLLDGNFMWVGSYEECNAIGFVQNPKTNRTFQGKYFTTVVLQNNKAISGQIPLMAGVCFPDSCNEANVSTLMNGLLKQAETFVPAIHNLNLSINGAITDCKGDLEKGTITTIVITGILVFLVFLGTAFDLIGGESQTKTESEPVPNRGEAAFMQDTADDRAGLLTQEAFSDSGTSHLHLQHGRCQNSKTILDIVRAFSLLSNAKKLFGTDTANGPLACLNGIRVLSMWWVILGHTYAFVVYFIDNSVEAEKVIQRFSFQPIFNGTFSVDSFFFLSGLLVAYLAIKEIKDNRMGKTFWVYFICHRYWRLTPLYGYVILLYTFVMRNLISGPYTAFLSGFNPFIDECKSSWWANLLYINNMYPYYGSLQKTCLGWSWYLANDMQFYLFLSPLVIILLTRERKVTRMLGIVVTMCLILMCIVARIIVVLHYGIYGLSGTPTKHTDEPLAKNGPLYARPYTRYSVYLVGMLVGYVLAVNKCRIRIPKVVALLGWITCIPVALSVIYGQYYYSHHPGTHMTMLQSVFYVSLCRTLWGLSLAWVVLASVAGKAWLVTDILSWKIWAPLGRLTYAAYLIHPILIYLVYFNQVKPIHFTDLTMVYYFLGCLVLSYALAFLLSMLVEAPMIQLEKAFTKLLRNAPQRLPRNILSRNT